MDYQAADQVDMDYQAADQVIENMEKESFSDEISDLTPKKPNRLFLKLKFSKTLKGCSQQHICSVCSKGFASGKALGGHIRIHNNGIKSVRRHRKISKLQPRNIYRYDSKKRNDDLPLISDQEGNQKVSCCICNKDFRSMKSLFGHMKNHPERGWRGIRPPPSNKNSCCSSVSENDEALEVDQICCIATEKSVVSSGSDLLNSLPKWTNTAKRCGKFINSDHDSEISDAAYCLMKLARGDSFDLGESSDGYRKTYSLTGKLTIDQTRSRSLENKASKTGQFQKFPMKPDEDEGEPSAIEGRYKSRIFPSSQTPGSYAENPSEGGLFEAPLNETAASPAEGKALTTFPKPATEAAESSQVCTPKMLDFNRFQKFPMKPDEEEGDPSAMEGSQTPGSHPKNPSGGLLETPLIETASSAAESSQVGTPKLLDFDLNEPYVPLDGEDIGTWIN